MENMLIKFLISLIVAINLFTYTVKAESEKLKQCFYVITQEQNSSSVKDELTLLNNAEISVIVVIEPNESINEKVIEVIEGFQNEPNIRVVLKDSDKLERSYFIVRGYNKRLKMSGICNINEKELTYVGEKTFSFNLIEITENPLKVISQINKAKETKSNLALVIKGGNFNISTVLLANEQLQGVSLKEETYILNLKKTPFIFTIFTYVGQVTIVFFSIAIVIFLTAILIFKKWSREKFID